MLSTSCGTNGSGSAVEPSLGNPFQDLEKNHTQSEYLANDSVQPFRWHDLQVKVKDRKTKAALFILTEAAGIVNAERCLLSWVPVARAKQLFSTH
jgi:hypothetical protein